MLLALVATSCRKTRVSDNIVRRVVGQYTFEKVTVSDGFLNMDNITHKYDQMVLQLNNKREAAIIDAKNGITYTGDWSITQVNNRYTDDDGSTSDVTYLLDIYVSAGRGKILHFDAYNTTINPHKLKFTVDRADGKYRYKLSKL